MWASIPLPLDGGQGLLHWEAFGFGGSLEEAKGTDLLLCFPSAAGLREVLSSLLGLPFP